MEGRQESRERMVLVKVWLPEPDHTEVKVLAARRHATIGTVVAGIVAEYFAAAKG